MKKLILFIIIAVFGFVLVGCNGNTNGNAVNTNEVIQAPTNLVITGTTLSWSAVDNAKGYNIYVNGELKTDIRNMSYDFSKLADTSNLIFKVQTLAPRGYQDSPMSVSLAYVPNRTNEISQVKQVLQNSNMVMSDEFSAELVDKGMTSTDLSLMIEEIQAAVSNMDNITDITELYTALTNIVNATSNVEAIVSAVVKYLAPQYIQLQIDSYQSRKTLLESSQSYYSDEEYQAMMKQYDDTIAQLNSINDMFTNEPDKAVLSITRTIDYFMSIIDGMTQDMVNTIQSLSERTGTAQMNPSEVVVVKDEMVNVLRDNMPSIQDVVMMIQFEQALLTVTSGTSNLNVQITNFDTKQATKILLSVNLFIDFLSSLDESFFQGIQTEAASDMINQMLNAEMSILAIKHFAVFKTANQDKFDAIDSVFTSDEKQIIYQNSIDKSSVLMSDTGYSSTYNPFTNMSFTDLLYLSEMMGSSFDILLNNFVTTDGEIIRIATILGSWNSDLSYNSALDETFTKTQYVEKEAMLQIKFAQQIYLLMGTVITGLSQNDFNTIMDYLITIAPYKEMFGLSASFDVSALVTLTQDSISVSYTQQFQFIQNLTIFIGDNDLFTQLISYQNNLDLYYQQTYGLEYANSDLYTQDLYANSMGIVLWAKNYSDFMTTLNRDLLDQILSSVFDYFTTSDMVDLTNTTASDYANAQTNLNTLLDYLKTEADLFKSYDTSNLTADQIENINTFQDNVSYYLTWMNSDPTIMPVLN